MAVFGAAILLYQIRHLPTPAEVQARFKPSDRVILDRHQRIIDEVRIEDQVRRLSWISIEDVPPAFVKAIKVSVGSPASILVADLLDTPREDEGLQKIRHFGKALALYIKWKERDLLEAYINLVHYRGELQGIGAASYGLFDKAPKSLTRPESALMAALTATPIAPVQEVREQACGILRVLGAPEECGFLTPEHLSYVERGYRIRPFVRMAPHVANRLVAAPQLEDGLIRSTLDRQIQWAAMHALQYQAGNVGAAIVIENVTGDVLAYVGHVGSSAKAMDADAAETRRQAGATLKPFVFAKAIDERILTAASMLEDSPFSFRDLVSVRRALAFSRNIPAMRALDLLGVENFVQTLRDLGLTEIGRADFYGPSLALGGIDVNLLELANAYRTLANSGTWSPIRFSPDLASEHIARRVFSPEATFIINDILADRGVPSVLHDNWALGFSQKYTVAVWTTENAAPVWQIVMDYLHRHKTTESPLPPPGVVKAKLTFSQSNENQEEWFITGTEPALSLMEGAVEINSRISYPLDQSVIRFDSHAVRRSHNLFIQIVAPKSDQNLYLNGQRLGRARAMLPWSPVAGRFTLELRNSKGVTLDKVSFEVRDQSTTSASM